MQCKHCGAEVGSEYRLCPYCRCELEYPDRHVIINNYYNSAAPGNNGTQTNRIDHPQQNSGNAAEQCPVQPQQLYPAPQQSFYQTNIYNSSKDKNIALVLCLFLGFLGVHRFYVGKNTSGIVYALTFGVFGMGWMLDIILILLGMFTDSKGRKLL